VCEILLSPRISLKENGGKIEGKILCFIFQWLCTLQLRLGQDLPAVMKI